MGAAATFEEFAVKARRIFPDYQALDRALERQDFNDVGIILRRESEVTIRPQIALDLFERGQRGELQRISRIAQMAGALLRQLQALTAQTQA